ncbi:Ras- protein Rab-25 [Borealophlyctis nickersoniae]|nr:Ras- protein Rab-25 [Borealophlyctis nickersoniae]
MSFTQEDIVNETIVKIMVLGDSDTGKSQLFQRILRRPFNPVSKPTAGIDFGTMTMKIATGKLVKAQIVDTSGLARFRSIIQQYWGLATGAVVVYDITNRDSFNEVRRWVRDFKEKANKAVNPIIMIVGNKLDLQDRAREVPTHEAQAYALAHGFLFMETSAMDNTNVELAFNVMLTDLYYVITSARNDTPRASIKVDEAPSSLGEYLRASASSVLPAQQSRYLSPLPSPDLDARPKSFDERLYEQARAIFSWGGWTGSDVGSETGSNAGDAEERRAEVGADDDAEDILSPSSEASREDSVRSPSPSGAERPAIPSRRSSLHPTGDPDAPLPRSATFPKTNRPHKKITTKPFDGFESTPGRIGEDLEKGAERRGGLVRAKTTMHRPSNYGRGRLA